MIRTITAGLLLPCLLTGALAQSSIERSKENVLARLTGERRDPVEVQKSIVAIESELVDLLARAAEHFGFRYTIPDEADPRAILAPYTRGRTKAEAAEAAFAELESRMERLETAIGAKRMADKVEGLGEDTLLLLWALKGHCVLESINFGEGGSSEPTTVPGGEPDYSVIGAVLTLESWRSTLALLGDAADQYADNAGGIGERRRQAEMVDLHYPNASNPLFW